MKPKKAVQKKEVTAYMILNCKHPTAIIEWSADCGCQAQFYDCPPVIKRRDAEEYMSAFDGEKIVPCTISYSLPKKQGKAKKR